MTFLQVQGQRDYAQLVRMDNRSGKTYSAANLRSSKVDAMSGKFKWVIPAWTLLSAIVNGQFQWQNDYKMTLENGNHNHNRSKQSSLRTKILGKEKQTAPGKQANK